PHPRRPRARRAPWRPPGTWSAAGRGGRAAWPAPARGVTRRRRGRVPPARMATLAQAGTAPGSAWSGRSLSSSLTGGGSWRTKVGRRTRAIRKAVGFAHGLRGFGGTVEVCSGEVPSGWYLPFIHREGRAAARAAEDGDGGCRGAPAEGAQSGADRVRLRAHVTLGPDVGQIQGDELPVDHNGHLLGRSWSRRDPASTRRTFRRVQGNPGRSRKVGQGIIRNCFRPARNVPRACSQHP